MIVETVKADVLCVGGGIASLMAAIRSAECGAKVVVADKSNTLRSGAGALGNDHFCCYIPEVHGRDINPIIRTVQGSIAGGMRHIEWYRTWLENCYEIIKLWESWGIPMKHEGRYEFAGHTMPGKPEIFLHYGGADQKKILTREARKRGVEIINRVMIFDLLVEDGIVGALGTDTREDRVYVILANSIILATGRCIRLYPAPVAGWMFNLAHYPSSTGDGMAMAYRAGAELCNVELMGRWVGPRYFARCGKASWIGVLRDPQGKPIGPFVTKPDKKFGDPISDIFPGVFREYEQTAKGPVYMDCRGISNEDYDYMMHFMRHEGLTGLTDHLKSEKIDLREHPVEFGSYELIPRGGIYHDLRGETAVKGLFAAGDEAYSFTGISMASTSGWLIGENAAHQALKGESRDMAGVQAMISDKIRFIEELKSRTDGPDWKEANIAVQQIMSDYAGEKRTETLLNTGVVYLRRLKEKLLAGMIARNQHELMHCLEVLDLMDVGEAIFVSANERRETRGLHKRLDYSYTNPLLEKFLVIERKADGPVTSWVDVRK
jgi:succinate dehydrogenase/fumarate reductase flavoprotein subunit